MNNQVEGLSQNLDFRVTDLEQQTKDAKASLNQVVDSTFHSDDKLLSGLQKLGYELDQDDPEEEQTVEQLREICMRYNPYLSLLSSPN